MAGEREVTKAAGGDRADRLATYRAKRDFTRTAEPAGGASAARGGRFVVQRHRARRLHYDVRLEIDGVLVSWAVPKGPTLDAGTRRAAFHVEDHPIEYIDFEGVIPAGQYGGGDVIVWDEGRWSPHQPADAAGAGAAVAAGELHVDLHGHKLAGRFVFVRTGTDRSGKEQWLLLHKHDEAAVPGWDPEDHPRSVRSGRTNEEVRAEPERLWRPGVPAAEAAVALRAPGAATTDPEELSGLDRLGASGVWEVFGRSLRVTNLDKVLFPGRPGEAPVTKRDLVRYAATIAPVAVPYLAGRALTMHRFPNGVTAPGFWHKELPAHAPSWITRWQAPSGGPTYAVVDEAATLVWAANFGAVEWHASTYRTAEPERPTYALIDIDPGTRTTWDEVLTLARLHRTALQHLGVRGRAKVTGQRGIQIWIPVATGPSFEATRTWAERLSRAVGAVVEDLVSWKWQVEERQGLARLDYTQNAGNKTLVAPYSPRPAPAAPVSAPIEWDELDDPNLRPDGFTVRSVLERVAQRGDLFAGALVADQHLPPLS